MDKIQTYWLGQKLEKRGFRLTPQRLMVLRCVEDAADHISADEIYAEVIIHYPQMNISTVYRTLELAKEQGLVTETDFGDGKMRYHCIEKGKSHHHLVCSKCGAVTEVASAALSPLRESILQQYNFNLNMHHLAISGECAACRK